MYSYNTDRLKWPVAKQCMGANLCQRYSHIEGIVYNTFERVLQARGLLSALANASRHVFAFAQKY